MYAHINMFFFFNEFLFVLPYSSLADTKQNKRVAGCFEFVRDCQNIRWKVIRAVHGVVNRSAEVVLYFSKFSRAERLLPLGLIKELTERVKPPRSVEKLLREQP